MIVRPSLKGRAAERFRLMSAWLYPSAGMTRIRFVGLEKLLSAPDRAPREML